MLDLRRGDRAPIVAACQSLLNAQACVEAPLSVDAQFGPLTEAAVNAFQRDAGLPESGTIDARTWAALSNGRGLAVHDSVDTFDPLLLESVATLVAGGASPVLLGGLCDALGMLRASITSRGVLPGSLTLLRFHGHGNRGTQAIGYGTGVHLVYDTLRRQPVPDLHGPLLPPNRAESDILALETSYSGLSLQHLAAPGVDVRLASLADLFSPFGSVEFHGCQVGGGASGTRFLAKFAGLLRVPALAGAHRQTTRDALRISGPVVMAFPGSTSLAGWAASRPRPIAC